MILLLALGIAALPSAALAEDRKGSVSGTAYFDANANGHPDPQERAVRNIEISLDGPDYHETRKTLDNGSYEFSELAAGKYTIGIKLPNGYGLSDAPTGDQTPDGKITLNVDGKTALISVNFGIARADQIPPSLRSPTGGLPPTPSSSTPIPLISSPPSSSAPSLGGAPLPTVRPTDVPPTASSLPGSATGSSGAAARLVPTAPGAQPTDSPAGSAASPSGGPSASGASSGSSRQAGGPTVTNVPTTAPTATTEPTTTSTPTMTPTPTRTPLAVDVQQAGAERAKAGLASLTMPRTASTREGDDALLDVPFRSAIDGSFYADTNSGSAAIGMVLESYGFSVPTADLRALANTLDRAYDVSQPPTLAYLVRVAEQAGLRSIGQYQGSRPAVWTADDVRARIRAGYPVVTMILPTDAGSDSPPAARFVVVVGVKGSDIIYHDPMYPDERGARRVVSGEALTRAWANGPNPSEAAGFALGPGELGLFAPVDRLMAAQQSGASDARPAATAATASTAAAPAPQLRPVENTAPPASDSDSGGFPFHPLLLAFWLTAAVVLFKVVSKLVTE
jgi:hypothetical protein